MAEEKNEKVNRPRRPYHRTTRNKKLEGEELVVKKERTENKNAEKIESKKAEGKRTETGKTSTRRNYNKKEQQKFEF